MPRLFTWLLSIVLLSTPLAAQIVQPTGEPFAWDESRPAAGLWLGSATTSEGQEIFVALSARHGEDSDWTVTITALAGGLLDAPCSDVEAVGNDFSFTITGVPDNPRFQGSVSEDGQLLSGATVGDDPERRGDFRLHRGLRPADAADPLAFSGNLVTQGITIPLTIVLAETPGGNWVGHLDIPMQGLREFPFVNFTETEAGEMTAFLPVPGGATITVTIDDPQQRLTGTFEQRGVSMALDLARDANYTYRDLVRPQTPQPPFPYREREVSAPHPDGFSLGGTLTLPDPEEFGAGPYPTVILITGSGQQDRNESLMGHSPFLVIADYLTRRGIAVMRYDDRGVGDSAVDEPTLVTEATSHDFATDTLAVVEKLKTIREVDIDRLGLIGHSEGGLIAPMVAQMSDDIAFAVLLAGPGARGDVLLIRQAEMLLSAAGVPDEAIEAQREVREKLFLAAIDDDEEAVSKHLRRLIQGEADYAGTELTEEELETGVAAARERLMSAWIRFFLAYDPVPALAEVTCPILALNGTLDLQVCHLQNLDAIQRVRVEAGLRITTIRYEGLNHLFQKAETGTIAEYVEIETTIEEEVMQDMAEWILGLAADEG
jgi:uncharacterized protein